MASSHMIFQWTCHARRLHVTEVNLVAGRMEGHELDLVHRILTFPRQSILGRTWQYAVKIEHQVKC